MRRRDFITLIGAGVAAWPVLAHGQQNRKPWRIRIPADIPASAATTRRFGAFRDGLKELGYAEGSNIVIDYRAVDGSRDGVIAPPTQRLPCRLSCALQPIRSPSGLWRV